MGASQSQEKDITSELVASTRLSPEQVTRIVDAFKDHSKKGKPVSRKAFLKVMNQVAVRYPDVPAFHPDNLNFLYSLFDVDHDGKGLFGLYEICKFSFFF